MFTIPDEVADRLINDNGQLFLRGVSNEDPPYAAQLVWGHYPPGSGLVAGTSNITGSDWDQIMMDMAADVSGQPSGVVAIQDAADPTAMPTGDGDDTNGS